MKTALVSSKEIADHRFRFEGNHYLNHYAYLSLQIERRKDKCAKLEDVATCFNPPVFKRQFCQDTENAVQYFQSSDVPSLEEKSKVFIYKGQAESLKLLVHKNDILVTGFGTIGNTRLVSRHQDGVCYANNVCRIQATGMSAGLIYAFMSSKYGAAQLNSNASGSVVRYIEAPGIKRTLIPLFSDIFQKEVDDLIQESARLREEAVDALEEAKGLIMDFCQEEYATTRLKRFVSVKIKGVRSTLNTRFDPTIYINKGVQWVKSIQKQSTRLGDLNVKMWYPGIFKRAYVENGLPYLKGSSVFDVNPFKTCDHLSKARTPKLDDLWLKEGMLLITCAGACGLVKMITKEYEDKGAIGSPDIIRLVSNDTLFTTEYIFAYLQLPPIYDYMQSLKYGSVIERFDIENIKTIPIVRPTEELSQTVTDIVKSYMDKTYRAFNCEEKAIQMVEQEIEKWNKH